MHYQLSIVSILNAKLGYHVEFEVKVSEFKDLLDSPNFKIEPNLKLQINAYRIQDGVCVSIPEQTIKGKAVDSFSQEEFQTEIKSFATEKNFYLKVPQDENKEEVGRIDPKSLEVVIDDLLNEAILLNIPLKFSKSQINKGPRTYSSSSQKVHNPTLKDFFN